MLDILNWTDDQHLLDLLKRPNMTDGFIDFWTFLRYSLNKINREERKVVNVTEPPVISHPTQFHVVNRPSNVVHVPAAPNKCDGSEIGLTELTVNSTPKASVGLVDSDIDLIDFTDPCDIDLIDFTEEIDLIDFEKNLSDDPIDMNDVDHSVVDVDSPPETDRLAFEYSTIKEFDPVRIIPIIRHRNTHLNNLDMWDFMGLCDIFEDPSYRPNRTYTQIRWEVTKKKKKRKKKKTESDRLCQSPTENYQVQSDKSTETDQLCQSPIMNEDEVLEETELPVCPQTTLSDDGNELNLSDLPVIPHCNP